MIATEPDIGVISAATERNIASPNTMQSSANDNACIHEVASEKVMSVQQEPNAVIDTDAALGVKAIENNQ